MPAPAECPGCGTKLLPNWENCPNCPLSFRDEPLERGALKSDSFRNYVMPVLICGGLGYGVWSLASFFWSTAEQTTRGDVSIRSSADGKRHVITEWKLRGRVYDLLTLKPLAGVSMIFTDNQTNSRAQAMTDARGLYRIILPPLQDRGYLVTMTKTGYVKSYLNPGAEGVSKMPLERRQELVRELAALILEPSSLEPGTEESLVTDFHLAPKN
jgi:hypothetical protein